MAGPSGAIDIDEKSYRAELAHFIAVIREETTYEPPTDQVRLLKIVEAIYLGQMVRYHLALEDDTQPVVAALPFLGRAFATGERVMVSWDAADLWPVGQ